MNLNLHILFKFNKIEMTEISQIVNNLVRNRIIVSHTIICPPLPEQGYELIHKIVCDNVDVKVYRKYNDSPTTTNSPKELKYNYYFSHEFDDGLTGFSFDLVGHLSHNGENDEFKGQQFSFR